MGKKIWLSMHPRDFGSEKIVPTNVSTSTPSCAFEAPTSLGDKSHGHPDFKREQKTTTTTTTTITETSLSFA